MFNWNSSSTYFFPTTNKNVKAKLQHEKNGNHLVLNFTEMGSVLGQANYQDDWGEHTQNCTAIFFKIPGEHIFENERGDMELQLNCSIFFNSLQKIVDKKIDETKLPIEISVDTFGDLMDGFSVFDGAYIYDAQLNFPPCDVSVSYVYIHRFLKISKTLLEQLKVCRKGDRIDQITGNARQASEDIPFFGIGVFQP